MSTGWESMMTYGDPLKLSLSTAGCGCCSDGKTVETAKEAVEVIKEHVKDLEEDAKFYKEWLVRMENSEVILPL